jgi:hypothetical protein
MTYLTDPPIKFNIIVKSLQSFDLHTNGFELQTSFDIIILIHHPWNLIDILKKS